MVWCPSPPPSLSPSLSLKLKHRKHFEKKRKRNKQHNKHKGRKEGQLSYRFFQWRYIDDDVDYKQLTAVVIDTKF